MAASSFSFSRFFNRIPEKLKSLSRNQKIAAGLASSFLLYKLTKKIFTRPKDLKGQVAFITGAGNGIGRQIAISMSKAGAKVVVADIDKSNAEVVANEIIAENGEAIAVYCDVSSQESIKLAASNVRSTYGDVTILVNNAGIVTLGSIIDLPIETIEKVIQVNLVSHFYTIKEFLPSMTSNNKGHIVEIASVAGFKGILGVSHYTCSKFGVVGFAESLRNELRVMNSDVKVTCICPAFVDTNMCAGLEINIPFLNQVKVGKRIVKAIQHNEKVVTMPWTLGCASFLIGTLPIDIVDRIFAYLYAAKMKQG